MDNKKVQFICHTCGKEVESVPDLPVYDVLEDWLMVTCWTGTGKVKRYDFCSSGCLRSWIDMRMPAIPDAFLKSFGEEVPEGGK